MRRAQLLAEQARLADRLNEPRLTQWDACTVGENRTVTVGGVSLAYNMLPLLDDIDPQEENAVWFRLAGLHPLCLVP